MVKTFRKSTGKMAMEKHLFDTTELSAMFLVRVKFHKLVKSNLKNQQRDMIVLFQFSVETSWKLKSKWKVNFEALYAQS